jgi:uncharacterized membrane protein (UPF0127 family)
MRASAGVAAPATSPARSRARRRLPTLAAAVVMTALTAAGAASCTSSADVAGGPVVGSTAPGSTAGSTGGAGTTTVTVSIPPHAGPRQAIPGFGEVTVVVHRSDGSTRTWCLLLADTDKLQEQGLMQVTDPALGGYDGMLFAFPSDTAGDFWMKDTLLPLSIVWSRADGTTAGIADMPPCPADTKDCPTYGPHTAYRYAIEVPEGGLARLGIDHGSTLEVGDHRCAAATAPATATEPAQAP